MRTPKPKASSLPLSVIGSRSQNKPLKELQARRSKLLVTNQRRNTNRMIRGNLVSSGRRNHQLHQDPRPVHPTTQYVGVPNAPPKLGNRCSCRHYHKQSRRTPRFRCTSGCSQTRGPGIIGITFNANRRTKISSIRCFTNRAEQIQHPRSIRLPAKTHGAGLLAPAKASSDWRWMHQPCPWLSCHSHART